jgi:ribonuclease BN (tRNA processing enzyme)
MIRFRFLGSGDAFGSGGRFMACFQVVHAGGAFLIDCGASSLIAMKARGIDPNRIDTVFISHLHGDHFGGLPFLLLDAQHVSRREAPLTVVGPPGLAERLTAAREVLFPRSTQVPSRFELRLVELAPGGGDEINGVAARAFEAAHFSGAPSLSLRLTVDDRVIAYSGDTEWTETLAEVAAGADLFVCEAYSSARKVSGHLDAPTLAAELPRIGARRVILTHMSAEMLAQPAPGGCEKAHDGLTLEI